MSNQVIGGIAEELKKFCHSVEIVSKDKLRIKRTSDKEEWIPVVITGSACRIHDRERNFDSKLATPDSLPRPNTGPCLPRSLELNDPFFFDSLREVIEKM